jgi:hypothetical protein
MVRPQPSQPADDYERLVSLGDGLTAIPERLLLAHSRGEVLFIAGAGVSLSAGLPDFRELVLKVYRHLDSAVHDVIDKLPHHANASSLPDLPALSPQQIAEVRRFANRDYDVVLGMLERRMDGEIRTTSSVRNAIAAELRTSLRQPEPIHRALPRLSDRGAGVAIVTTNFDRLFEQAAGKRKSGLQSYSIGDIPRPSRAKEFAGVLHIHGVLESDAARASEFVVSDRDFGEYYLRRRSIPDFIYDAARLYHLVLVGYSANDPPMRYLLNAVAADGTRFLDLKERFTFLGTEKIDAVEIEDWRGRGITPIRYSSADGHVELRKLLTRWADLLGNNNSPKRLDSEIKRIASLKHGDATEDDRTLFAHLIRRSDPVERARLSALASNQQADFAWLDSIAAVALEPDAARR